MAAIVGAFFQFLEFTVLGAFALLVIVFALAIVNPVYDQTRTYIRMLFDFTLADTIIRSAEARMLGIVLFVGLLYFAGSFVNLTAYTCFNCLHENIIDAAYLELDRRLSPIELLQYTNNSTVHYHDSSRIALNHLALNHYEVYNDLFSGRVKLIRLMRGTVFCSFLWLILSVLKFLIGILSLFFVRNLNVQDKPPISTRDVSLAAHWTRFFLAPKFGIPSINFELKHDIEKGNVPSSIGSDNIEIKNDLKDHTILLSIKYSAKSSSVKTPTSENNRIAPYELATTMSISNLAMMIVSVIILYFSALSYAAAEFEFHRVLLLYFQNLPTDI